MVDARERERESEVFNGVEAVHEKRKKEDIIGLNSFKCSARYKAYLVLVNKPLSELEKGMDLILRA